MQIEEKKYKPTPEAIESEINDIYVEDIDLEEYRHRFRNSDFSKSVSESTSSIEYVDFNGRYDKYSSYSMYPLYAYLLWKHLSCLIEYKKSLQSWDSGRFI